MNRFSGAKRKVVLTGKVKKKSGLPDPSEHLQTVLTIIIAG